VRLDRVMRENEGDAFATSDEGKKRKKKKRTVFRFVNEIRASRAAVVALLGSALRIVSRRAPRAGAQVRAGLRGERIRAFALGERGHVGVFGGRGARRGRSPARGERRRLGVGWGGEDPLERRHPARRGSSRDGSAGLARGGGGDAAGRGEPRVQAGPGCVGAKDVSRQETAKHACARSTGDDGRGSRDKRPTMRAESFLISGDVTRMRDALFRSSGASAALGRSPTSGRERAGPRDDASAAKERLVTPRAGEDASRSATRAL